MHEFGCGSKGLNAAAVAVIGAACALPLMFTAAAAGDSPSEGNGGIILYVHDDAPLGGDGLSWDAPLRYLQDALAIANAPGSGVSEIRLGQGLYKPDQGANHTQGDVNATFTVPGGLALRGGYAGFGADDPDARDFRLYESVLSGDLLDNDGPPGSFENYADNTRRIVHVLGSDAPTLVQGIIIRAARGLEGFGPPSQVGGGGLYCISGQIEVSNCVFQANRALWGGGAFVAGSIATLTECRFIQNGCDGAAGGLYGGTSFDCEFIANRGFGAGSAAAGSGHFIRCHFQDNFAGGHGGAIWTGGVVIDCEFINNLAQEEGGAIHGFPTIVNSTFRENIAYAGGAVRGIATIVNCRFVNNLGYMGSAFWGGGTIMNCEFIANQTISWIPGGAVGVCTPTSGLQICAPADFINCIFQANVSWWGGAAWIQSPQTASFTNCTFTNNLSLDDSGGAISTYNGPNPPAVAIVRNCILWNNSPGELNGPVDVQFSCVKNGWPGQSNISMDPLFVDPLGPDGVTGTEDDDLRLSSGSPCIDAGDNTALPSDSHDVDGDGNLLELLPIDLEGNLRRINDPATPDTGNPGIYHVLVDIGALEFADITPVFADISGDGFVGVDDLLTVINAWGACSAQPQDCPADLDSSGAVDMQDLLLVLANWM